MGVAVFRRLTGRRGFSSVKRTEACIAKRELTGVLTRYPIDMGAWE
jgi:hypothetical protein